MISNDTLPTFIGGCWRRGCYQNCPLDWQPSFIIWNYFFFVCRICILLSLCFLFVWFASAMRRFSESKRRVKNVFHVLLFFRDAFHRSTTFFFKSPTVHFTFFISTYHHLPGSDVEIETLKRNFSCSS